jgi:MinD-like ATPase involved in chromosome partitioning or flagellar assembly
MMALTLARALGHQARVVVVDLAFGTSPLTLVSATPGAPGLADAIRGTASFGEMITKDSLSRVHLVSAGQVGRDAAAVIGSPRFATTIEALSRTYDHVILDAGSLDTAPVARLAEVATFAVLVAGSAKPKAVKAAEGILAKAGFADRDVLGEAPAVAAA